MTTSILVIQAPPAAQSRPKWLPSKMKKVPYRTLILFAALGGRASVSLLSHLSIALSHVTLVVASAGGSNCRNMPFLTMTTTLANSGMQLRHYPYSLPFPSEIETASKGIESLSLPQQALLKEGFLHPETPITFQKVKTDTDIKRKSLHDRHTPTNLSIVMKKNKVPVIVTTISTSLPHRRRVLFLNNTTTEQIIPKTGNTVSSSSATALADNDETSESESETNIVADPQTPPVPKRTTRPKKGPAAKDEPAVKTEKSKQGKSSKAGARKRSHSVTLVSSGGKSDSLPRNASPKRARFANGSESSFEIGDVTPAAKPRKSAPSKPATRASKGAASKGKSAPYKSKAYVDSGEDSGDEEKDIGPAPTSSSRSSLSNHCPTRAHCIQNSQVALNQRQSRVIVSQQKELVHIS